MAALREAVLIDSEHADARRSLEAREADLAREQKEAQRARERAAAVASALQAAGAAPSHEAALAALRSALDLDPDHAEAKRLYVRHETTLNAERERARRVAELIATAQRSTTHETAITALRQALALDAANAEARRLLEERQRTLDRERKLAAALETAARASSTEAAVTALREAARIAPADTDVARQLKQKEAVLAQERAEAERAREREEAISASLRTAANAPTHAAALAAVRAALELDPNHAEARRLLESHETALKREEAAERQRREIAAAREQIESQIARGEWEQAAHGIQALQRTRDGKKIARPLRRRFRDQKAEAARHLRREQARTAAESAQGGTPTAGPRGRQPLIAIAAGSVLALTLGGWWLLKSRPANPSTPAPSRTAAPSSAATSPSVAPQPGPQAGQTVRSQDDRAATQGAARSATAETVRESDASDSRVAPQGPSPQGPAAVSARQSPGGPQRRNDGPQARRRGSGASNIARHAVSRRASRIGTRAEAGGWR